MLLHISVHHSSVNHLYVRFHFVLTLFRIEHLNRFRSQIMYYFGLLFWDKNDKNLIFAFCIEQGSKNLRDGFSCSCVSSSEYFCGFARLRVFGLFRQKNVSAQQIPVTNKKHPKTPVTTYTIDQSAKMDY